MRAMSFMLTTPQMRAETKTVTRRVGWTNLKPGDRIKAVEKGMGLKKGERQVVIGVIEVVSIRLEALEILPNSRMTSLGPDYGDQECVKEGFPELSPSEFVTMFCASHKGCTPETIVTRIEFKHVEGAI